MKCVVLAIVLGMQGGGGPADGMQLYRDGKFAEAAAAFRAAIDRDGDSAELEWNLALASWRAGDLTAAEIAAEKYAAMAKNARTDLHAGLLGAVRHAEALALEQKADAASQAPPPAAAPGAPAGEQPQDPLPMLEQALAKATQAKDHFVRGADANATPELLRNTERSLRTIDELQKKIDELKKQREEQKKKDDQQKKDDEKGDDKKDQQKQDEQKKDDEQQKKDEQQQKNDKKDQKQDDQKQDGKQGKDDKPEPKPDQQGEEKPEPKPEQGKQGQQNDEPKDAPKDGKQAGEQPPQGEPQDKPGERHDAPGETQQGKELSAEQLQRLLDDLKKSDDKLKALRMRGKTGRRPVERDW